MAYVILLVLLVGVVFLVSSPWRRPRTATLAAARSQPSPDVLELEAARDAKLREIRDAELDQQTGKLSDGDYVAIDSTLRSEAIDILRRLDEVRDRV